eukprot:CAMPEP_0201686942 /NCGR_PEP_ID=MMETSP0578-20130828/1196_1 /ASSEMBLY_ACC=CAM_ASM_000663 /TAXON_ID=267565 /ORGANISM="Skeletonema grethea, Strain CCMP 1804" /LENGTH=1628 /DNA_ID=CAMNT_0048171049 /DNA_START=385 /DNA_END=5268 /DNA_ORIENTATION=-
MLRTIVLSLSFLSWTRNHPADKPFLIQSVESQKAIGNLFSELAAVDGIDSYTTIVQMMETDLNKVNALKNRDGMTPDDNVDKLDPLKLDNTYLQTEEIFTDLFGIYGVGVNSYKHTLHGESRDSHAMSIFGVHHPLHQDLTYEYDGREFWGMSSARLDEYHRITPLTQRFTHQLYDKFCFCVWGEVIVDLLVLFGRRDYEAITGGVMAIRDDGIVHNTHKYHSLALSAMYPIFFEHDSSRGYECVKTEKFGQASLLHTMIKPLHVDAHVSQAWGVILFSFIRVICTQHRLIRFLTQRLDQHLLLNLVTVWGDVFTTSPVTSFWILGNDEISSNVTLIRVNSVTCNKSAHSALCLCHKILTTAIFTASIADYCTGIHGRSLGGINDIVGASSNDYMTYHGWGNIVGYVMKYNSVSAPQVVFCKEFGERAFAEISTYFHRRGYSIADYDFTSTVQLSCDVSVVSPHDFHSHMQDALPEVSIDNNSVLAEVSIDNNSTVDSCHNWSFIIMTADCCRHPSIWNITTSLPVHIYRALYKKTQRIVSFQHGEDLASTHRLNHTILLRGDDSCMSCTPSASNDLVSSAYDSHRTGFWKLISSYKTSTLGLLVDCYAESRFADDITSLVIGNDTHEIDIAALFNGEQLLYPIYCRYELRVHIHPCNFTGSKTCHIIQTTTTFYYAYYHLINARCLFSSTILLLHVAFDGILSPCMATSSGPFGVVFTSDYLSRHNQIHDQVRCKHVQADHVQVTTTLQVTPATPHTNNNDVSSYFDAVDCHHDPATIGHYLSKWGAFDATSCSILTHVTGDAYGSCDGNETSASVTASPGEFMPSIDDIRSYDRVSRNDGGDTMLRDESRLSELVDGVDMTCLTENDEIIDDDNDGMDGMMSIVAVSSRDGEPYHLLDMTDTFIKCIPLLVGHGELCLLNIMGLYWRENASRADRQMTMRTYHHLNDYTCSTIRSLDSVWNIESDGIAFRLESRETMGRLALQKTETNEEKGYVRRINLVEELEERFEQMQNSTKSTGNSNFENLVDRDNGEIDRQEKKKKLECEILRTFAGKRDTFNNIVIDGCKKTALHESNLATLRNNVRSGIRICMETLAFNEDYGGQLQSELKIGHIKSKLILIGSGGTNFMKLVERDDILNLIGLRSNERYTHCGNFNFNRDVTTASLARISERYEYDISDSTTRLLLRGTTHPSSVGSIRGDSLSDTVVREPGGRFLRNIFIHNCDEFDRDYNPCCVVLRKRHIADSGFILGRMSGPSHQLMNLVHDDIMQTENIALEKETIGTIQSVRNDLEKAMTRLVPQCNRAPYQCRSKTIGHDESAETGKYCCLGLECKIDCPLQLIGLGLKTTLIGERFVGRIEKTVNVNFIQDAIATVGYSMFVIYGNPKQQLMKRRYNICADDTVCASMQQLVNSAHCSSCCRLVIMAIPFANLHTSIACINASRSLSNVSNTTEEKQQTVVLRRDMLPDGRANTPTDTCFGIGSLTCRTMDFIIESYCLDLPILIGRSKFNAYHNTSHTHTSICGLGYSHDDVLDERLCYSYANFGLFVGSLLLLRHFMGSHTLQTADFKMRQGHELIRYRHRTDMPDITDFTFPAQNWNDTPFKIIERNTPWLASKGTISNRLIRRFVW